MCRLSLLWFACRCCFCVEVVKVCSLKSCLNKSLVLGVPVASCSNSNRSNTFYRCCFLIQCQVYSSQLMKFGSDIIGDKDHGFISSRRDFEPCYLSSAQKLQPHSKYSRISQWFAFNLTYQSDHGVKGLTDCQNRLIDQSSLVVTMRAYCLGSSNRRSSHSELSPDCLQFGNEDSIRLFYRPLP